jgi:hypothetical protein
VSQLNKRFVRNIKIMQELDMQEELTTKLNGIILRKAELDKNFTSVYYRVFERMQRLEEMGGEDFLSVLGEVGG